MKKKLKKLVLYLKDKKARLVLLQASLVSFILVLLIITFISLAPTGKTKALTIKNNGATIPNLTVNTRYGDVVISGPGTLELDEGKYLFSSLKISGGAVVTHKVHNLGENLGPFGLYFEVTRDFTLNNATIDLSQKGYRGGLQLGNSSINGEGPGGGKNDRCNNDGCGGAGGGSGGFGGQSSTWSTNGKAYDLNDLPNYDASEANAYILGSGGAGTKTCNEERGGRGGGGIIIKANKITIQGGKIHSNGENCHDNGCDGYAGGSGGGAGGVIILNTMEAQGMITVASGSELKANGGTGDGTGIYCGELSYGGGGAGGGIIQFYAPKSKISLNIIPEAKGGDHSSDKWWGTEQGWQNPYCPPRHYKNGCDGVVDKYPYLRFSKEPASVGTSPGKTITWNLVVKNTAPFIYTGPLYFKDTLPAGFIITDPGTISKGSLETRPANGASGTVGWKTSDVTIMSGETVTLTFKARVP